MSQNEFKEFTQETKTNGSEKNLLSILDQIQKSLPSIPAVFGQLLLVHGFSSLLTLIACPQFGMRVFFPAEAQSLMDVFMVLGHEACFFLCGVFYLGSSFLFAKWILSSDSFLVIKRSRFVMVMSLALLSLGFFRMWGDALSFELTFLWFLGAYLGASLSTREWWKYKMAASQP